MKSITYTYILIGSIFLSLSLISTQAYAYISNIRTYVDTNFTQADGDYTLDDVNNDFGDYPSFNLDDIISGSTSAPRGITDLTPFSNIIPQLATFTNNTHIVNNELKVTYTAGSYSDNGGGAGRRSQITSPSTSATLSYKVRFDENFERGADNIGGKIHGLCSASCPGNGSNPSGWNVRLMRRPVATGSGARLVAYTYWKDKLSGLTYGQDIPLLENNPLVKIGEDGAMSLADNTPITHTYGAVDSLAGKNVTRIQAGQNYNIKLRVTMNNSAQSRDGRIEVWVNNQRKLFATGLNFGNPSNSDELAHFGLFQTFHGGGNTSRSPSTDVHAYFDNFKLTTPRRKIYKQKKYLSLLTDGDPQLALSPRNIDYISNRTTQLSNQ